MIPAKAPTTRAQTASTFRLLSVLPFLSSVSPSLRRHLPGGHSFGAFRLEEDLHRGEDDLQVRDHVHGADILQVHLELIIGSCVVFAVNLGEARKACLGLEPQGELREILLILPGNLRTLGAGAHDGHGAEQDAEKLGHLVDAQHTDDFPHRGDAVVIGLGQPGHAVLFGVYPHTAELVDIEFLPVFGEPQLLIEDGAAVVGLDGNGRDQHKGAEHHQGQKAQEDVRQPLDSQIPDGGAGPVAQQHRQTVQLEGPGPLDEEVADVGPDVGLHPPVDAILHQVVAQAGGDAAEHHRPGRLRLDLAAQLLRPLPGIQASQDAENPRQTLQDGFAVLLGILVVIDQQDGPLGQQLRRQLFHAVGPEGAHQNGCRDQGQHRPQAGHGAHQQRRHQIHDGAAQHRRDGVGIGQLPGTVEGHVEAAVKLGENSVQHRKQQDDDQVALGKEGEDIHLFLVAAVPHEGKQGPIHQGQHQAESGHQRLALLLAVKHLCSLQSAKFPFRIVTLLLYSFRMSFQE